MSLSQIIRDRRELLGLTQDEVAQRAGMSKPYLSNIETGRIDNPPSNRILEALERVLKFEEGTLTYLADEERTPPDVRDRQMKLQAEVTKLRAILARLAQSRRAGGNDSPAEAISRLLQASENRGELQIELEALTAEAAAAPMLASGSLVPVINKVAAGYPHHFTDLDYPPSVADEYVRCPDVHDGKAFAARIVGDSMEPAYHEGDIVIFSPNTPAADGNDCFVRFEGDGGTTFKRAYQDDEGSLRLQPLNSKYPAEVHPRTSITGLWPAVFRIERLRR